MGGGKGGAQSSAQTQAAEVQIAQATEALGAQSNQRAGQLFSASFPGFQESENYYQQLASGDPAAISRAIAPAAQQITQQAQQSAENITQNMARGGEKNLALEENQINKGAQIGQLASQSYLGSFGSLAGLAGQGVGESQASSGIALSGLSSAGSQEGAIAQQQQEAKSSQLGFISSLAGSASGAMGCWIADAVFGEGSIEAETVRFYVNNYVKFHWFGKYICMLYWKCGPWVAQKVRTSAYWGRPFTILYKWLLLRAQYTLTYAEKRKLADTWYERKAHAGKHSTT